MLQGPAHLVPAKVLQELARHRDLARRLRVALGRHLRSARSAHSAACFGPGPRPCPVPRLYGALLLPLSGSRGIEFEQRLVRAL